MYEIIPGILEKEWSEIEKKIALVKPFAKTIHIDLLDGIFAPNTTFLDPAPFAEYTKDLFFEVHMMVDNPLKYLQPFADAGFKRFIGHIEKMNDIPEFIAKGQMLGEVGLAIDVETKIEEISVPLDDLDFIFMMAVKAGFSQQAFMPDMLEKVRKIRTKSLTLPIAIDGGINDKTIMQAKQAGVTRFISTSFVYHSESPKVQYEKLCALVSSS